MAERLTCRPDHIAFGAADVGEDGTPPGPAVRAARGAFPSQESAPPTESRRRPGRPGQDRLRSDRQPRARPQAFATADQDRRRPLHGTGRFRARPWQTNRRSAQAPRPPADRSTAGPVVPKSHQPREHTWQPDKATNKRIMHNALKEPLSGRNPAPSRQRLHC